MRLKRGIDVAKVCMALALPAVLFGCADKAGEPTLTSLWDAELKNCALNCHQPGGTAEDGPDLSTKDQFYTNLVNKTVNNDYPAWAAVKTGDCNAVPFITPGDAGRSTVVASLIQTYSDQLTASDGCNSSYNLHDVNQVTLDGRPIADDLVEWINAGAPNN